MAAQQNIKHTEHQSAPVETPAAAINGREALSMKDNRSGAIQQKKLVAGMNRQPASLPLQKKSNHTGIPDQLKNGLENLSGIAMDDVKVHYNSAAPATVQAHAYAQGSDIHIAPGQEKHLPHEAWHVVQQKQGRVKPTRQLKSKININDDKGLEAEADTMGAKAINAAPASMPLQQVAVNSGNDTIMRKVGFEYEIGSVSTEKDVAWFSTDWKPHKKGAVIKSRTGYDITADVNQFGQGTNLEFITKPVDEMSPGAAGILTNVAANIVADLTAIVAASYGPFADQDNWVTLNRVARINGSKSERVQSAINDVNNSPGQLQMTGGVGMGSLHKVLSGSALGQEPRRADNLLLPNPVAAETKRETLGKYYSSNPAGNTKQPIWHQALEEVSARFDDGWDAPSRRIIASVCALMSQIPIEKRADNGLFASGSGLLLAKTDYSTILQMAVDAVGKKIDATLFLNSLLATINAFVPEDQRVASGSSVFPDHYRTIPANQHGLPQHQQTPLTFTELTIGDWVRQAMPTSVPDLPLFPMMDDPMMGMGVQREKMVKGKDMLSKEHFPGTETQKKEMRAYGTFGSKKDPGDKLIMEWRSFSTCYPDALQDAMLALLAYNSSL